MQVALIVAVAENGVIGHANRLPWQIKSEMQHFVNTTRGKPVVMGRKTFASIGKALKDRPTIVITRDSAFAFEGVQVAGSVEEALQLAKTFSAEEVMVAGGSEIYRQALPLADKVYLTRVHCAPEGDAFFPALNTAEWEKVRAETHKAKPEETADYTVELWVRKI